MDRECWASLVLPAKSCSLPVAPACVLSRTSLHFSQTVSALVKAVQGLSDYFPSVLLEKQSAFEVSASKISFFESIES